ncbi:MAG: putative oxidoreductase C-terminal domain-containing protein [Kiritimatiellia bacterium]
MLQLVSMLFSSVGLIALDPGHFHAALTLKRANPEIAADVRVFAPQGRELDEYLQFVDSFNGRRVAPTAWRTNVYAGADYLEKFRLAASAGAFGKQAVVVLAGRNDRKGAYALAAVEAGCHVLADKPMAITPAVFAETCRAASLAKEQGLAFADMMTGRYSFRSRLAARLARCRAFYGEQEQGTPENPAVVSRSVHHFCKFVDGRPLRRPEWYYDTTKQGEGIVDVATHMVDCVQWSLFPGQRLSVGDVRVLSAKEWPTVISPEQYRLSTGGEANAPFDCLCNGEFTYALRGVCCKVSVVWNVQAPAGSGDTSYALMRGTKAEVFITDGAVSGLRSGLYARSRAQDPAGFAASLRMALAELSVQTPGLACERTDDPALWRITYPGKYEVSHEEQFSLVLGDFLRQVSGGRPDTDGIDNLIVKYHTLVKAWELAHGLCRFSEPHGLTKGKTQ